MNRSSSNSQLNSPHRSSDAESETDKTVYEGEDIVYLSGPSFNLEYVNSQVKLLEAKLNHEKLNFNKMFSDMQSHYKGRLSELEGKLEASKARNLELEKLEGKLRVSEAENMQVKELVAEKTKLENYNSKLQSQLEIHKYKLQQSEKKRQLDQENGKNLLNKVNQQLQDEKMVSKDLVKKLAATQLQKEELMKLVDEKELANTVVQKELQEVRTNNQKLAKRQEEIEERRRRNIREEYLAKMDKFMTDANERHEKEIAKIKEEAKEKCQQQVIKSKKDVMLMSEKEHKEITRLKKELEQVEKRYQNQLVRVNQFNELYHKTLTTTKEELSQANAFHQEQVTKAQQAHDLESKKHHRELAQITEIVQEQSKELDEARQQLTEFRTKNLDELEKIKKEADDNIQKQLWEKLKAQQEADQTKQKVGAMVEKCKVAEMRVTELEKQLGESLTASEKLKLDFAQLMTTKNHMESKELEEMISIATKENDELKKKYQDVEEELKQAYAYSSKQKSELESKLAAANEECKKTSELKSKALKECVQLKAEDELNKSEIKKLNQRLIAMTEQCKKDKLDFEAKIKPLFATPSFSKQQQQKSNPPVNAETSHTPKNSALSDTQSWRRRQLNDRLASCPTSVSTNMPINICVNTSNTFNYAPLNMQPQTGWALARGPFNTHKRVSACSPAGPSRFAKFSRRNENEQPRSGLQMDQQLYEFCKNTCERNNGNPFGPNNQSHLPTGNNIYSAHELNYRESRHPRPFGSFCNSGRGRMF